MKCKIIMEEYQRKHIEHNLMKMVFKTAMLFYKTRLSFWLQKSAELQRLWLIEKLKSIYGTSSTSCVLLPTKYRVKTWKAGHIIRILYVGLLIDTIEKIGHNCSCEAAGDTRLLQPLHYCHRGNCRPVKLWDVWWDETRPKFRYFRYCQRS